ncbi:hypothetical protein chiPu_0033090, partial [Chiloscyllium punctatum]|nr:hypothetical protein [Chiloscyllium punctatum]
MRRSEPPAAASIRPTGASPWRCAGSEMAQPSSTLISEGLRSARKFSVANALSSARLAMVGGRFAVVGSTIA